MSEVTQAGKTRDPAGRGARLSGPPGAHGGALPPRSLRLRAGGADVPHRRPAALEDGRHAGVRGATGRPGEDPRLPHRAGRGAERALRPPAGARGARDGARGPAGGEAAGGVPSQRRGRWGAAGAPAPRPPRVHGACRVRGDGAAPADPRRQAGREGPPRAGDGGGGRVPAACHGGAGSAGRIWTEVLVVEWVGVRDDFFALGGTRYSSCG